MLCALPIILVIALQCVAGAPIEDKGSSTTTGATSEWPDKDILEPFNLRAQYVHKLGSCDVEVLFNRGLNDTKYDYSISAQSGSKDVLLEPRLRSGPSHSLAIVDPTAKGQRGAYPMYGNFTHTPVYVDICAEGGSADKVKMLKLHASLKDKDIWVSKPFKITDKVIPKGHPISLKASRLDKSDFVNLSWDYTGDDDGDHAFYAMIGLPGGTETLETVFTTGGYVARFKIKEDKDIKGWHATVNSFGGDSILGLPSLAPDVPIQGA